MLIPLDALDAICRALILVPLNALDAICRALTVCSGSPTPYVAQGELQRFFFFFHYVACG